MKIETISAAVCTCNGERYIAQQLESILGQVRAVDEIIICDDRSEDTTLEIAARVLEKSGIAHRIIQNPVRLGVTRNFEKCTGLCSGDVIFTSDQDDLWDPHKTEKLLCCFAEDPACVLAFSDANIIDGNGDPILESLHKKDGFMQTGHSFDNFQDDILRLNFTVYGCTMAFKREFISRIMPFYCSEANHDAWIMCCAGLYGTVRYLAEPLISYRIHGLNCVGSVDGNPKWDKVSAVQDGFDRHFAMQKLRTLRITLLREALSRGGNTGGAYAARCKKAIRLYERLDGAKTRPAAGIFSLLLSVPDGSYRYRFCDRGRTLTGMKMLKQLPHDILYLIKWRKQLK